MNKTIKAFYPSKKKTLLTTLEVLRIRILESRVLVTDIERCRCLCECVRHLSESLEELDHE